MSQRQKDIDEIKRIIIDKDRQGVEENATRFILDYPRDEELLLLICQIFESDWHTSHEDMASCFQYIKNAITEKSLFNVVFSEFEYCKWDENYPLQRKCTWGLADIGTNESKRFLQEIEQKANKTIAHFAAKRLQNWNSELGRKGPMLRSDKKHEFHILLEKYSDSIDNLPADGQQIIGNLLKTRHHRVRNYKTGELEEMENEYIVLYQAYKPGIANYAVENQKLGGPDFRYARMSWIKPNFLWMMYRCGWAEKENQERVLAIWIKKEVFEEILGNAVLTSYQPNHFASENEWRNELETKKVRLQWDPDHNYLGEKIERRAIQLGLKDEVLEKFGKEQIECILDITGFVKEQKRLIDTNQIDKLLIPKERIIDFDSEELMRVIGNGR